MAKNDFQFVRDNPVPPIELMQCEVLPGRFRNFSGDPEKGFGSNKRTCCITIPDKAFAEELKAYGWNVGILAPRDETEEAKYFLQVKVAFRDKFGNLKNEQMQPKIFMVNSRNKIRMSEDMVSDIDQQIITSAKARITGSRWEKASTNERGISAYLDSLVYTIREDDFLKNALGGFSEEDDLPF